MATALCSSQWLSWKNGAPNVAQTSRQIFAISIREQRDRHLMFNQGEAIQKALQTDGGYSLPRALSGIFRIGFCASLPEALLHHWRGRPSTLALRRQLYKDLALRGTLAEPGLGRILGCPRRVEQPSRRGKETGAGG
ncbi:hypothetical protein ROHU_007157 [Labeo rohita]|uniref:Uncharacterized protein n=1 Tax=Labeo rohita TaxID=84645 RepID=A0A498MIG8_LABRO|nr:hypothetical protein ROHU_034269 [Labeo rohita]RXN19940.1 hypothetical protein ROHU_007157 [Labeo rohita]